MFSFPCISICALYRPSCTRGAARGVTPCCVTAFVEDKRACGAEIAALRTGVFLIVLGAGTGVFLIVLAAGTGALDSTLGRRRGTRKRASRTCADPSRAVVVRSIFGGEDASILAVCAAGASVRGAGIPNPMRGRVASADTRPLGASACVGTGATARAGGVLGRTAAARNAKLGLNRISDALEASLTPTVLELSPMYACADRIYAPKSGVLGRDPPRRGNNCGALGAGDGACECGM